MTKPLPTPEFSRTLVVADLPRDPLVHRIAATPAECEALARRFGLQAIERLEASLEIRPARGGRLTRIHGRLEATVVQTCVVTLEPVRNQVAEEFTAAFGTLDQPPAAVRELDLDFGADEEDDPEPIEGGTIDIGELTAQHLCLALDPYPRVPGARFSGLPTGEADEADDEPFGVLARLSQRS